MARSCSRALPPASGASISANVSRAFSNFLRGAVISGGLVALTARGQTVLADLRSDYDAGAAGVAGQTSSGKISDSVHSGSWNFYSSELVNPTGSGANLTLLTYATTANSVRAANAYIYTGATTAFDLPAWSNSVLITPSSNDGAPASNELEVHPGQLTPNFAVARWTSGYTGAVRLAGAFHDIGSFGDGVTFDIYLNGASIFSASPFHNTLASFDQNIAVTAGDSIYFLVGHGPNNDFGGDSSALSATITAIPEPSTWAACAGLAALGLVARRRRR